MSILKQHAPVTVPGHQSRHGASRGSVTDVDPRWHVLARTLVSTMGGGWREHDTAVEIELPAFTGEEHRAALIGLGVCLWHLGRPIVLDASRVRPPHLELLDVVTTLLAAGLAVTVLHPGNPLERSLSRWGLRDVLPVSERV